MNSLASVEAPPDVFARALGERPRANAFPVPNVGGVDGLFSTGWLLVRAASESGRLRRLTTELDELAKTNVPQAEDLLLLAQIADSSAAGNELPGLIDKRLGPDNQAANIIHLAVVGAACLERKELRATGQYVFETLLEHLGPAASAYARPFLRRARAIAILKQHEGTELELLSDTGLEFWIPASEESAARSATGAVRDVWLVHENHILHLAGPNNDYLCFRYPLSGNFEFQVEAQNGGKEHTFGNVAFGGLAYDVTHNEFRVGGLDMGQKLSRPFPFIRREEWPTYQRLTLRSTEKGVEHLVNGHPVWTDPLPHSTSPWLALRCFGEFIPAFRNFRLTGNPVIPREVRMSDGNWLRGWFTQFYPSHVSHAVPLTGDAASIAAATPLDPLDASPSSPEQSHYDWLIRDGVIHGAQRSELFRAAVQSRLAYFRPLQNEESIAYEFLYEPGKHEVHPALGRLAFLIEPNGVRVHWLTAGEAEWTGLAENNATIEPLNRRGPRPLPLNPAQWNRLRMALSKDTLTLTLNDVEIYARKMDAGNSRRFSLYYDRSRSAAQVRNVVMHGDWLERLTDEQRNDLLVPRQTAHTSAGRPSASRSAAASTNAP
jgi:hypothetical protein